MRNKLSDGSMDSYHLKGLLYCLSPLLLILPFFFEIITLSFLSKRSMGTISIFVELALAILFFALSVYISYFFMKQCLKNFKRKYIFYSLLTLYLFLVSITITLNWLFSSLAVFLNISVLFLHVDLPLIYPYNRLENIFKGLFVSFSNMMVVYIPLSISYALNFLLPSSLQTKEISMKKKIIRLFSKVVFLSLVIGLSIIFSVIDESNFSSITIFTTLFTFMCTPKVILRLFSNYKNIEHITISEEILRTFDTLKLFYYEFIFSWSISIYIFKPESSEKKMIIFVIVLFVLMFISIIAKMILSKPNNKAFSKWVVPYDNKKYRYRGAKNYRRKNSYKENLR